MSLIASSTTTIKPQCLPLTERAAYFHSLRVHLQVIEWKSLMNVSLNPAAWGWRIIDGIYEPIMTDQGPAPENITKLIRCNCRLTSKNVCGTMVCTCRRTGLPCIAACGHCNGKDCQIANVDECIDNDNDEIGTSNIFDLSIWD